MAIERVARIRDELALSVHLHSVPRSLLFVAFCGLACALAARMTRKYSPFSAGSGIAHVEAVLNSDIPPAPLSLVPLKFLGATLGIGAGLLLGPEGPSVQMGAGLAYFLGKLFRRRWLDSRVLLAAGAGAGLAAVFNAPLAGAVFVLEELVKRFEMRIAIIALGASAAAIWVARFFIGDEPDFRIVPSHYATLGNGLAYLAMGAGLGFAGITYNRTLLGTLRLADRVRRWPTEVRAALVGSAIGLVGLSQPFLVGTGEPLTQQILSASVGIRLLLLLFLVRLALGAISYASGTPGGLLAPILALGAIAGEACGYGFRAGFPGLGVQPEAFAMVGMAAFMSAVNRSPLTAIVLVLEMTGNFPIFLPMLCACYSAMLVPTLFRDCALYDRLRERLLETAKR